VDEGWDVGADATKCPSPGSKQLEQWINGEDPVGRLDLNYPYATYVCVDGGLRGQVSTAVWGEISKLIGQTRDFPINGVSPADGGSQVMNAQGTQVDLYNIIGFAHMEIVNLLDPQEAAGTPAVDGICTKNNSSALAIGTHSWSEFGNGNGCPGSTAVDAVDTVTLGSLQYGSDFSYNNSGFTLTKALPNHSNVSFNWHVYPVPGKCGTDPLRIRALDA
jgi:hypothetical protein